MTRVSPPAAGPVVAGRLASLDVLRGIAVLGTFATNVWLFAHPGGPGAWLAEAGTVPADLAGRIEIGLEAVANGKFLALLTLLFGIGIELQYRSAQRRGLPWPGRYPLRAGILLAEGFVHYLLVFEADVLMGYAITSFLVAHLIGRSDRVVRLWSSVVGGIFVVAILGVTAVLLAEPDRTRSAAAATGVTDSWPAQVLGRLEHLPLYRAETLLIVPSGTVLFLIGSRLMRAGAFAAGAKGARIRRGLMAVGVGVGVPLNVLTAVAGSDWYLVGRYLVPPIVALGLLGLVTEVVLGVRGGAGRRALASVGRTALSCYVLQNVLASIACYGWGFGLAGRFADARPWWVLGLWAVVSLVNVVAAGLWLRRHDRGPVEILMGRLYRTRSHDRRFRTRDCPRDSPGS